ncbi:hypothetical protein D9757_013140 [Collybiopsis confluens]|uniref:Uncharacterized protein n=1 Tax=Collybiopsis confluens TaxID=2823264 RepID=A0A8H5LUV0_9AGAR|nr:hypothetical protein D9757_013140 [Collybiopsis confluens]
MGDPDLSLAVDLQVVTYVTVSFLTLLFYDWIICFNQEGKGHTYMDVEVEFDQGPVLDSEIYAVCGVDNCERLASTCDLMTVNTVLSGSIIGMANLILMLRTYSLYNKSRKILAIFALSWISVGVVCGWAVNRYTDSFHVTQSSNSCFVSNEPKIGLVTYISLLGAEVVITLLTVWKTFDSYLKSGFHFGQAISMVYCEGLYFYFLIIPFTIANTAIIVSVSDGLLALLSSPLTVMHAILCCRLVLHVREVTERSEEGAADDSDELLPTFIIEVIEPYMSGKGPRYYV